MDDGGRGHEARHAVVFLGLVLLVGLVLAVWRTTETTGEEDFRSSVESSQWTESETITTEGSTDREEVVQLIRERVFGESEMTTSQYLIEYEEAIQSCMAQHGFKYLPRRHGDVTGHSPGGLVPLVDRKEAASEFGYGHTTQFWQQERDNAVAVTEYEDPNIDMMELMSDAERAAWNEALNGPVIETVENTEEGGVVEIYDSEAGCKYQAEVSLHGIDMNRLGDATSRAIEEEWELVGANPQVIAADQAWHACMAADGFPIEAQTANVEGVQMDVGGWFVTGDVLAIAWADRLFSQATWTTETLITNEGSEVTIEVPVIETDELQQAQDQEIQLALTDIACDEETNRTATIERVRGDVQDRVIDEHFTDLVEALVDGGN